MRLSIPLSLAFTWHLSSPHGFNMNDYQWLSFNTQTQLNTRRWEVSQVRRAWAGGGGRPWGKPKHGVGSGEQYGVKLHSVLCPEQPWTSLLPSLSVNVLICKNHQLTVKTICHRGHDHLLVGALSHSIISVQVLMGAPSDIFCISLGLV